MKPLTEKSIEKPFFGAKNWTRKNIDSYLPSLGSYDYSRFSYKFDEEFHKELSIGGDVGFLTKKPTVFIISLKDLNWVRDRARHLISRGFEEPEFDLESIFVHEFAESLVVQNPNALLDVIAEHQTAHNFARYLENVRRNEKGLRDWRY
jgi:hypothetical protein